MFLFGARSHVNETQTKINIATRTRTACVKETRSLKDYKDEENTKKESHTSVLTKKKIDREGQRKKNEHLNETQDSLRSSKKENEKRSKQ
ncbi:hypothetical protein STCU_10025 [Strigomonas culicis]|uniref:Uncharacterized protein n=1 Tax=Strigomonas culicis TaxID=28005 RepID=S9V618_9TRYP|nr:hypothetical protein STCU_10025 [Strigomonas culicis]|eukprot:EPY18355.1 hypothetical protein STCU_10025 [Strigomonas culicis]